MTDHKKEAESIIEPLDDEMKQFIGEDQSAREIISAGYARAQVHATLYLADQQRIANVIAMNSMDTETFDRLSINTSVTAIREGLGLA